MKYGSTFTVILRSYDCNFVWFISLFNSRWWYLWRNTTRQDGL